jgi:ATP-dependent protease HslVU (ClpYQ) peptidase subunit
MSVVAWDGKTLAADRKASIGDMSFEATKIWKIKGKKSACAFCGDLSRGIAMMEWFKAGGDSPPPPIKEGGVNGCFIYVVDGTCAFIEGEDPPIPVESPFMAWGSGRELAYGAMASGKTAELAVAIANIYSPGCGFGIDSYKVQK